VYQQVVRVLQKCKYQICDEHQPSTPWVVGTSPMPPNI
jgi:hypothetical protein